MAAIEKISEQLDYILNQVAKSQQITNFEINKNIEAIHGDGFVAQFYTGDIRNKNNGETTNVAIKKAPVWDMDFNAIFKNEELFYSKIFPALDDLQKANRVLKPFTPIPKYFCGEIIPKNEYIAMENLKPLGYVMFDKKEYLDKGHLEIIFKTYGKFHALSYVLRKKNVKEYQNIAKELTILKPQMWMKKQMNVAVSAAVNALDLEKDKIVLEELHDFGENVFGMYLKATTYDGEHRCLVHGDCWSNNMLFKYSESGELLDIKLIDFQICQDNTPIHDLSYFFYSGASKKDFDSLDSYLQIYYKSFSDYAIELGANPEELFSFEALRKEWKENALYGVILGIFLWQVKLIPKEDFSHILNPSEGPRPSVEESNKLWEVVLAKVHKTNLYQERTTAILRHAFEYGIVNKNKIVGNKILENYRKF